MKSLLKLCSFLAFVGQALPVHAQNSEFDERREATVTAVGGETVTLTYARGHSGYKPSYWVNVKSARVDLKRKLTYTGANYSVVLVIASNGFGSGQTTLVLPCKLDSSVCELTAEDGKGHHFTVGHYPNSNSYGLTMTAIFNGRPLVDSYNNEQKPYFQFLELY